MRRSLLSPAVAALILLVLPAAAESRYVVEGAGNGHGVGMSQYGAYGYAKHGKSYEQILLHYFRGTELSEARGRDVRVLLQRNHEPGVAFDGAARVGDRKLNPEKTYLARPAAGGGIEVREKGGKTVDRFADPVTAEPDADSIRLLGTTINDVTDGAYRGVMELSNEGSRGATAINVVDLEEYLWGVIPTEMPSNWHGEALKAQAVAARSYALTGLIGDASFDLYPDQRSQVYGGQSAEDPRTTAAARATRGQVLRYDGEIATTYFSSASGGRTENAENSFYGDPVPYLKSVRDPHDDLSPLHRWKRKFSRREVERKLDGLFSGDFKRVRVLERGESARVVRARVEGSRGGSVVTGATLRSRLGLPDTWASVRRSGERSRAAAQPPASASVNGASSLENLLIAAPLPIAP